MPPTPKKILEKFRNSPKGHKRNALERLYKGYGFEITGDGPHDKIKHPKYPQLLTFLPRHKDLAPSYFKIAVQLIDQLEALIEKEEHANE